MATHGTNAAAPRVAITRPAGDSDELVELLTAAGATVLNTPLIRIEAPAEPAPLVEALTRLDSFDWIVFTSANAVAAVAAVAPPARAAGRPAVAAVGAATADTVRRELGWEVDVVPAEFTGAALVDVLNGHTRLKGAHILWPRAEHARPETGEAVRAAGARLEDPVAYRTVADPAEAQRLSMLVDEGVVDVIAFTAPSAVRCLAETRRRPVPCLVAVIGPTTAQTARELGLAPDIEPEEHTIPGLAAAIAEHWWQR